MRHCAGAVFRTQHSENSKGSTYWLQEFLKLAFKYWDVLNEMPKNCDKGDIYLFIYLLRPWAAHKTYKDKKLKTTGTHTNKKR